MSQAAFARLTREAFQGRFSARGRGCVTNEQLIETWHLLVGAKED
jgi:hypothetical protein